MAPKALFDPEQFKDLLFKLQKTNEPRQRAVHIAFHAKGGVSLIVGPHGTGKTDSLALIVFLGVAYGHKTLLCAASNRAVNRLFRGLLRLKELCQKNDADQYVDWTKFNPIRLYLSEAELNYVKRPKSHQDLGNAGSSNEDGDDDEVDNSSEPFFEMLRDFEDKTWVEYHRLTSPHYGFPNHSLGAAVIRRMDQDLEDLKSAHTADQIKALNKEERIRKDPSYELRTALEEYNDPPKGRMSRKRLRNLLVLSKEQCLRVVNSAYIIATTNNNAGCILLAKYDPTLVVVADAGQSTEASALVPTTRWPSTKLRIFSGNKKQLQPVVTSRKYNEFYLQMAMSLFERLRSLEYQEQTIL